MSSGFKISSQLLNTENLLAVTSVITDSGSGGGGTGGIGPQGFQGVPGLGGAQGVQGPSNGGGGGGDLNMNPVKVGLDSGSVNQGTNAVAVGIGAGQVDQAQNAVAIGSATANSGQGEGAIAIGQDAGRDNQGTNSIAIGGLAGTSDQPANSIILNATGAPVDANEPGLFISPVREPTTTVTTSVPDGQPLAYNPATGEIARTYIGTYMLDDQLLDSLNLPPRGQSGDTGAAQTPPGTLPYSVNNIQYAYPFQPLNLVYVPSGAVGGQGTFNFTENISSKMTLDAMSNMSLGLCDIGLTWSTTSSPPDATTIKWKAIAMSTTAQTIAIVSGLNGAVLGSIYMSRDAGQTWTVVPDAQGDFVDITMTESGQAIYAVTASATLWSSYDGGNTWVSTEQPLLAPGASATSVATYSSGGDVYVSTIGPTGSPSNVFIFRNPSLYTFLFIDAYDPTTGADIFYQVQGPVTKIALASGGFIGYMCTNRDYTSPPSPDGPNKAELPTKGIYYSFNDFTDFLTKTNAPAIAWRTLACSGNGRHIVAAGLDEATSEDRLWVSADFGGSWMSHTIINVVACSLSYTGQYQVAVQNDGVVWISDNYGMVWLPRRNLPADNRPYTDVAMTSSGQEIYAIANQEPVAKSTSRLCGAFGERGFQGDTGATGPSGGPTGPVGPQGFQGMQGIQGSQGFTGPQGFGLQGLQGPTGLQGLQGFTGLGFQGLSGPTGIQGPQGRQGAQGFTGLGFQGRQGRQGSQGRQGPQGRQGFQGRGAQGFAGPVGALGPQGRQGFTGLGFQGRQGPTGRQGAQGRQGFQGRGAQGIQGPRGEPGGAVIESNPVKIGLDSGRNNQAINATAVGIFAGNSNQATKSVAIGWQAGMFNQGPNSIAIGPQAGLTDQASNSIVLNASEELLNAGSSGFFVNPVRFNAGFGIAGTAGLQGAPGPQGVTGPMSGIGGADTQLQFNSGGAFTGSPNLTFNSSTNVLAVGASTPATSGFQVFGSFTQGLTGVAPATAGGARLGVSNVGRYLEVQTSTSNTSQLLFKSLDNSGTVAFDGRIQCTGGLSTSTGYGDMEVRGRNFTFATTSTNDAPFLSIQPNVRYPTASLYASNVAPRTVSIAHIIASDGAIEGEGGTRTITLPSFNGYRLEIMFRNPVADAVLYNGFFIPNQVSNTGTYSPASATTIGSTLAITLSNTGAQPTITFTNNYPSTPPPVYAASYMVLAWML